MRSTLKPLLSLASHLQVIARGGGGGGGGMNLSVIFQGFITYKPPLLPRIQEATVCPVVPEVASSLNWCGSQSSLPWHVVYWAVLNSFKSMMFDASPVTHIMWKTNLKM